MKEQKRTPFTLVCDEAHLYLPIKEDADAVQKQALYIFYSPYPLHCFRNASIASLIA